MTRGTRLWHTQPLHEKVTAFTKKTSLTCVSSQSLGEVTPVLDRDEMGEESQNLIMQHVRSASFVSTPLRAKNYDVVKKVLPSLLTSDIQWRPRALHSVHVSWKSSEMAHLVSKCNKEGYAAACSWRYLSSTYIMCGAGDDIHCN